MVAEAGLQWDKASLDFLYEGQHVIERKLEPFAGGISLSVHRPRPPRPPRARGDRPSPQDRSVAGGEACLRVGRTGGGSEWTWEGSRAAGTHRGRHRRHLHRPAARQRRDRRDRRRQDAHDAAGSVAGRRRRRRGRPRRGRTPAADVRTVIHGTTLVTNAIIERKGATTALHRRPAGFATRSRSAASTATTCTTSSSSCRSRSCRAGCASRCDERILADGSVLQPLTFARGRTLAAELARRASRRSPSRSCTPTATRSTSG